MKTGTVLLVVIFALLAFVIGMALSGCAPTNMAEIIKAASTDPAMVHAQVVTPWGTATYDRNLPRNSP